MQNDPSLNDGPGGMPSPEGSVRADLTLHNPASTYNNEPVYRESGPQPGYVPMPQPGYVPPGYMPMPPGYVPPVSQPGYIPSTPPPGYVPMPPGYMPPPGYVPPGPPPVAPRPGRPNGLAIAGVIFAVIVVLAVVFGAISLSRTPPGTPAVATPTTRASNATPAGQLGQPTSAFQAAACPFQLGAGIVDGQQVSCGYVSVPEDRGVNDGKTVKLAIAIFKSPKYMNSVDPDPVIRPRRRPRWPFVVRLGAICHRRQL